MWEYKKTIELEQWNIWKYKYRNAYKWYVSHLHMNRRMGCVHVHVYVSKRIYISIFIKMVNIEQNLQKKREREKENIQIQ